MHSLFHPETKTRPRAGEERDGGERKRETETETETQRQNDQSMTRKMDISGEGCAARGKGQDDITAVKQFHKTMQ